MLLNSLPPCPQWRGGQGWFRIRIPEHSGLEGPSGDQPVLPCCQGRVTWGVGHGNTSRWVWNVPRVGDGWAALEFFLVWKVGPLVLQFMATAPCPVPGHQIRIWEHSLHHPLQSWSKRGCPEARVTARAELSFVEAPWTHKAHGDFRNKAGGVTLENNPPLELQPPPLGLCQLTPAAWCQVQEQYHGQKVLWAVSGSGCHKAANNL